MSGEPPENTDRHPLSGAEFLNPKATVYEDDWSRNPSDYSITRRFRQRFKELRGIIDGDDIDDAFEYGELVRASAGCVAFVLYKEGYTLSVVVARDDNTEELYTETVWPYIYDERTIRSEGVLSSKQIWRIEKYVGEHSHKWSDWSR